MVRYQVDNFERVPSLKDVFPPLKDLSLVGFLDELSDCFGDEDIEKVSVLGDCIELGSILAVLDQIDPCWVVKIDSCTFIRLVIAGLCVVEMFYNAVK